MHEIQVHSLEAILTLSAEQMAGAAHSGQTQRRDSLAWIAGGPGQTGRPRSEAEAAPPAPQDRRRSPIPAYEKLRQDRGLNSTCWVR